MGSSGHRSLRTATRLALFLAILLSVVPAVGSAALVVVPNEETASEGSDANRFPFGCASGLVPSMRYQQVYDRSQIGTGVITHIAFRQDGGGLGAAFGPTLIPGVTITLSSTSNGQDTLSTTFATNVGADVRVVFSGDLILSSAASAAVPRPFDIVIPLQTSFFFDAAANKNLLLDVTIPTCAATTTFDAVDSAFDGVSRVFATSSADATGSIDPRGLVTQFTLALAPSVSPGQIGDALILPLWDVNSLNTLIAIESLNPATAVYRVRFRDDAGNNVLEFTLCLSDLSTWTAAIFREGPLTRVVSESTLLTNGSAVPLNATLAGNPTRGYIEVIGLRQIQPIGLAICTDPTIGGDVGKTSVSGKAYYVNPLQSPILAYGANALAISDFDTVKITDGTVLGNNGVAKALIGQGPGSSKRFYTRFFVAPSFGAITQVVMTFPTGPNTGPCPSCRVPANLKFQAFSEPGINKAIFNRSTDGKLVNVFDVTTSDIAGSSSGVLEILETPPSPVSIPITGFGVQTTTNTEGTIFNVLFPLSIR